MGGGPEMYFIMPGISADEYDILGEYVASVKLFSGTLPAAYRLKATLLGEVLWDVEGELTADMTTSDDYTAVVDVYEPHGDPDCVVPEITPVPTPAPTEGICGGGI